MRRFMLVVMVMALSLVVAQAAGAAQNSWSPWTGPRVNMGLVAAGTDGMMYAVQGRATGSSPGLVSRDGGMSWQQFFGPPMTGNPERLAVDPRDSRTVYIAAEAEGNKDGLYRSRDAGASWTQVYDGSRGRVHAVTVAYDPPHRLILAVGPDAPAPNIPGGGYPILQSDNGGDTWQEMMRDTVGPSMGPDGIVGLGTLNGDIIAAPVGYHGGHVQRITGPQQSVDMPGSNPPQCFFIQPTAVAGGNARGTLYVAWGSAAMGSRGALRRTVDGGQSWQDATPPMRGKTGQQCGTYDPSLTALAVDPTDARHVFTAGGWCDAVNEDGTCPANRWTVEVFASQNAGQTWTQVGGKLAVDSVYDLAYSPTSQTLTAATSNGMWQYTFGATPPPPNPPPPGGYPIAPWFRNWWATHDGLRLLGSPIANATTIDGWPAQMFEKGRVEDHSAVERDPNWRIMYGLLVDELVSGQAALPVGGDRSTVTYATLAAQAAENKRLAPPAGLTRGTWQMRDGSVFVPYDAYLNSAPGHTVPPVFWSYINRADLFPGGWLHDIGLPMSEPINATVDKGDITGRQILIQPFQRTVLTYDPANPRAWQVERANVGTDYQTWQRR